jgi:DNA/RNA-binding domain of Phe-tRNA-synthetase-like protein
VTAAELETRPGWVTPELRTELPGLELLQATVAASPGGRRRGVARRLWELSNRYTGGRAVTMRQEPVPRAYRAFFRQIGLDPDDQRTPVEEAVLERMRRGGFPVRGIPEDAVLVATVETGVPVIALDADRVEGEVGLRLVGRRERLGEGDRAPALPTGQVVVADRARPLGLLFGELVEDVLPGPSTERMLLVATRVPGVPEVIAEEALWIATELLTLVR